MTINLDASNHTGTVQVNAIGHGQGRVHGNDQRHGHDQVHGYSLVHGHV